MTTTKRTDELEPGDRVALPGGRTRTVSHVEATDYVNRNDVPILSVMYVEGATLDWSAGNSSSSSSEWTVL